MYFLLHKVMFALTKKRIFSLITLDQLARFFVSGDDVVMRVCNHILNAFKIEVSKLYSFKENPYA